MKRNHEATCQWCHRPLRSCRRSKTYCSDACKQAAYYQRRKEKTGTGIEGAGQGTPAGTAAASPGSMAGFVAVGLDNLIYTGQTEGQQPELITKQSTEKPFHMNSNKNGTAVVPPAAGTTINVMGMIVNKQWIERMLLAVPADQKRRLSLLLLQTVLEQSPELARTLVEAYGPGRQEATGFNTRHDPMDWAEGGSDNSEITERLYPRTGNDEPDNDEGYNSGEEDDDPEDNWHEDGIKEHEQEEAHEEEEQEHEGGEAQEREYEQEEQENEYEEYEGAYEQEREAEQDGHESSEGHEYVTRTSTADKGIPYRNIPHHNNNTVTAQPEQPLYAVTDESSGLSYRKRQQRTQPDQNVTGARQYAGSKRNEWSPDTDRQRVNRYGNNTSRKQSSTGNWLDRFSSPAIRREAKIWEELSVTVPSFMEDYLTRYAMESGMQWEIGDMDARNLVTVHLLFHRSRDRRCMGRLLDLVLEAEEGLVGEEDFREGGSLYVPADPEAHLSGFERNEYPDSQYPYDNRQQGWDYDPLYHHQHPHFQARPPGNEAASSILQFLGIK